MAARAKERGLLKLQLGPLGGVQLVELIAVVAIVAVLIAKIAAVGHRQQPLVRRRGHDDARRVILQLDRVVRRMAFHAIAHAEDQVGMLLRKDDPMLGVKLDLGRTVLVVAGIAG